MGQQPGDQTEILLVFGTLMVFFALLAVVTAGVHWIRTHPGEMSMRFTLIKDELQEMIFRLIRRLHFGEMSGI